MNAKRKTLLERVASAPEELLDEIAESVEEIVAWHKAGPYHATPDELQAIDEAIADAERGNFASEEEVRRAFAKFAPSPPVGEGRFA